MVERRPEGIPLAEISPLGDELLDPLRVPALGGVVKLPRDSHCRAAGEHGGHNDHASIHGSNPPMPFKPQFPRYYVAMMRALVATGQSPRAA